MKKIIFAMVFVFATGTMMNANVSTETPITTTAKAIEIVEDFGCASDCVRWARGNTFEIAEDIGDHPNDDDMYMEIYMRYYTGCLRGC
ncbi:hypothetical protein [Polaribacter atrinae]|uniref:hypothetical protein n=1 Tax=Polaribacter atrinae TaxID=1333662 RepID=UPI0030F88358